MIDISGIVRLDSYPLQIVGSKELDCNGAPAGLTISAEVRLDNRTELIKELGLTGRPEISSSGDCSIPDHHVVLAAYEKWGQECVEHLLGEFAFVICDAQRRQLFAARDHLGVRPFFYFYNEGVFIFASSALGVVGRPEVPLELNMEKLAGFLLQAVRIVSQTETWFNNIERLPPAHSLVLDSAGLRKRSYWQPDPDKELRLSSDREYADVFEELFDGAVQAQLCGAGTTGAMLSGGMDSSTIVGLAQRQLANTGASPLYTYSGISDESDCIESGYIRKVIAHCTVEPSLLRPSEVHLYEKELKQADEMSADPSDHVWCLLRLMFLRAKSDGHISLLSGIDGDAVASLGPDYPAYLLRSGSLLRAVRELQGQHRHYYRTGKPTLGEYMHMFRRAAVPAALRRLRLSYTLAGNTQRMVEKSFISDSLSEAVDLRERLLAHNRESGVDLSPSLRHSHVLQIHDPYLVGAAELYDRLASSFGMKCRHPLLDKRLVEFCVSLPWDQKCRDGWSKYAMRQVAARVLPQEVAWRPGFEQISWKFTAARSQLNRQEELDTAPNLARAFKGLVSVKKVDQSIRRLQKKEVDYDQQLLEFLSLASWLGRLGIHSM